MYKRSGAVFDCCRPRRRVLDEAQVRNYEHGSHKATLTFYRSQVYFWDCGMTPVAYEATRLYL